jgi:hypothetical protein
MRPRVARALVGLGHLARGVRWGLWLSKRAASGKEMLEMTLQAKTPEGGHKGLTLETGRGRLALWVVPPGFLVFQLVGHGEKSFTGPIVSGFERALGQAALVQMFVDAELMSTYDTALRTEVTAAFLPKRQRIGSLHIVVRSKIVAMGVSVANLALGGLMTIYKDVGSFQTALSSSITRAGVHGFSASALVQERKRWTG